MVTILTVGSIQTWCPKLLPVDTTTWRRAERSPERAWLLAERAAERPCATEPPLKGGLRSGEAQPGQQSHRSHRCPVEAHVCSQMSPQVSFAAQVGN